MPVSISPASVVSILRSQTDGEVVYLYDAESERGNDHFAFRAVRFRNPTDSTLETGPVTVYGSERFIADFQPVELRRIQSAFEFSRRVLECR